MMSDSHGHGHLHSPIKKLKSVLKNREQGSSTKRHKFGHKKRVSIRKSLKKKVKFSLPRGYKDHLCGYDD